MARYVCTAAAGLAWLLVIEPTAVLADFYDCFNDLSYTRDETDPNFTDPNLYVFDPNHWDIDNPEWLTYVPLQSPNAITAQDGELRLWTYGGGVFGQFALLVAYVDTQDPDPNTSETYWDDSASHYILVRARNRCEEANPNRGRVTLFLNANELTWTGGYALTYEFYKYGSSTLFGIAGVNGMWWDSMTGHHFPPLDEQGGFWMLLQFKSDGNGGDPNGKYIQAACWDGGKYDWDGTWIDNLHLAEPEAWDNPNAADLYDLMGGRTAVASYGDVYWHGPDGYPSDVSVDEVEVRTGEFSAAPKRLDLQVVNAQYGTITIDPLLADPNDPNMPEERLLRYTAGTEVVLTAEAVSGRSWKQWTIYDPNFPGDVAHATTDTNAVLYLTMDQDYQIEAAFKCGSGVTMIPFGLSMVLGVVMFRRRTA